MKTLLIVSIISLAGVSAQASTERIAESVTTNTVAQVPNLDPYLHQDCYFRMVGTRKYADPKNQNVTAGMVSFIQGIRPLYTKPSGDFGTTFVAKDSSNRNVYFLLGATAMDRFELQNDLRIEALCF